MSSFIGSGTGVDSSPQYLDALAQHYNVGRTLGAGSFGKVKLAEHKLTGNKVAIKIMKRKKIKGAGLDEKVQREIKISSQLNHPHIIKIYETMETSEDIYVILEYAQSGELFDYITERGKLPESEARAFFQQLISGIECCHKKMVAHRDIKPENILLDKRNRIKIADFGLSNAMREGHFLKTSCGSPQYAAPEIVSGRLYGGPEVDVWSCGVVLFAMLCGSLPFDDENIPRLFKKIRSGVFSFPTTSAVDPKARDLIKRMLHKDQLERITVEDIWKHPWFKIDLPPYLLALRTERASALHFDAAALDRCVAWDFDRHAIVADLRGRRMTPGTVAYHLCVNNTNPYGRYEQTDADGVEDVARAMEALTGPGGEGDTNVYSREHPDTAAIDRESDRGGGKDGLVQRRWRVGLRSNRLVRYVIEDLKKGLLAVGATWKLGPVPYNFKCRVSMPTAGWAAGVLAHGAGRWAAEGASAGNGATNGAGVNNGGTLNGDGGPGQMGGWNMPMTPRTPRTPGTPHSIQSVMMDYMDADTGPFIRTPRTPAKGATPPHTPRGPATPNGKHRVLHALGTRPGWHTVKFEVQIYKLRPGCYVVDMQRLEGHVYHYLDLCGDLCTLLMRSAASGHAAGYSIRVI